MRDRIRWAPGLVLAAGCILMGAGSTQHQVPPAAPLTSLPTEIGGYKGRDEVVPEDQRQVAGMHDKRLDLVLIDDAHPAAANVDDLDRDPMEMHPVRDWAAFGDCKQRSDITAAQSARNQVAVEHSRPALARGSASASQNELRLERRKLCSGR